MSDQSNQALLQDLIDTLPDTISQLDTSIESINEQIDFLTDDSLGVSAVMSMMTTAASGWMDDKAFDLNPSYQVITSGSWGINNLIEWAIVDPALGLDSYIVYTDVDVTSGAPSATETQQFNRQLDFPEAYDHLNHDLGIDGTYGIYDKIDKLNISLGLQTINRDKYKTFLKAYDRNKDL